MKHKHTHSLFNLSHDRKLTFDMGQLVPFLLFDVLPGDKISCQTKLLARHLALLAPYMHQNDLRIYYYFVPDRLVHADWEAFIGGGETGIEGDSIISPTITSPSPNGYGIHSLWDHMGLPTGVANLKVSARPFRAYYLIWNEWFRQQWVQAPLPVNKGNGNDATPYALQYKAWEKDYFTSALPQTQKGPAVLLPLGDKAPLKGLSVTNNYSAVSSKGYVSTEADGTQIPAGAVGHEINANGYFIQHPRLGAIGPNNPPLLFADLTSASALVVNAIRDAFQAQQYFEINAECGSRYTELVKHHFGATSADSRLQRPEFLGGGTTRMIISEVLQTSAAISQPTPQGNMAGHGFASDKTPRFSRRFTEHGWVIGLIACQPRTAYQQGISRMWSRTSRFDYAWPVFSHLGEQQIKQKELKATGNAAIDELGFGYNQRFDEYRRIESKVSGLFKTELDFWHLGRVFNNDPQLNGDFIKCNPSKRIFADESTPGCLVHAIHNIKALRTLPKRGTPGYIDHRN